MPRRDRKNERKHTGNDITDIVSPETRIRMMSGIRSKNTRPEIVVRKWFIHMVMASDCIERICRASRILFYLDITPSFLCMDASGIVMKGVSTPQLQPREQNGG